nr:MAG: ATP synthase F0 subunit B [Bacillota bacterium]
MKHVAWTFVNFLVLLWILNRFLYKPLLGMIEAREKEIEESLRKAAEDRAEAERLRREFTEQVARAQQEAQAIIAEATRSAQQEADRILTEAREKAAQDLERAQETIRLEKERALAELRQEVASLAVAVAGKIIERSLTDEDHTRLAAKFVEEVGKH